MNRTSRPDVISYQQQQKANTINGVQYPKGVIKKTWAFGYPRENDIKIEEVLQKHDLELAVLSSFQWDDEWIMSKLDIKKTKVICVVQSENEEHVSIQYTFAVILSRPVQPMLESSPS
jgi:hypothetical protein